MTMYVHLKSIINDLVCPHCGSIGHHVSKGTRSIQLKHFSFGSMLVGGGLFALTVIYILILFFDRKRYRKETYIYKHYGYQPFIIYGIIIGLSLLTAFALQMIFSTILYNLMNTIAAQFGYPLLSSHSLLSYLLTFFITATLIIIIEGVYYYATCTSKHS